ncbi:cylicin-2-like [Macrosteles quadrilineatus]|uniref:cylicin-2-like n=1 Tax=Macrosteles quadrilineatus TaxID=74068 RepID=UPI0023E0D309|nr:cylicin-2-like [Macrosteles quadrilineatus]
MMGTSTNNAQILDMDNKEECSEKSNDEEIEDLEWSPDQEILLLYSLHGLKPVGPHKHFRMIKIHERLSSAMNKRISPSIIWKKLNCWYDMEALDEAEAEADAASAVEVDFELPLDEYSELIEQKLRELPPTIRRQNTEPEANMENIVELQKDNQAESDTSSQDQKLGLSDGESSKESDSSKGITTPKNTGKEIPKRGSKRTLTPVKDNTPQKKDSSKESGKKDTLKKEDSKKGQVRDEEKIEAVRKSVLDSKKDLKKEDGNKLNKKDSLTKKLPEQTKKEVEAKKSDQKKTLDTSKNQRETPKPLRSDSAKRGETKITRSETPKQKVDLKKEVNSDKKKEMEKKTEGKSPEKTPESSRTGKLRGRKDVDSEKLETPTGTKRTKESMSKSTESLTDEPPKKTKMPAVKGRPTRNSMEPQKPASPAPSPQKRRTRML